MSHRLSSPARLVAVATLTFGAAACADAPTSLQPVDPGADPSFAAAPNANRAIPGRFIVTLEPRENPRAVAAAYGIQPDYVYETAIVGFAGSIAEAARAGLLRDNRVVRIEQDQVMSISATTQSPATWGLDRIDARSGLNNSYTYNNDGSGVRAYIIDTGILLSHNEFGGRAVKGYDAITAGGTASDCNGHGTHVAGTTGGATYGVAKGVSLVAIRVLDCNGSGTTSGVIAGVDWVTANHVKPAVANMSLGGGASSTLDAAVASSISAGVTYALAAGNGDRLGRQLDACTTSPARVGAGITIGATTSSDAKTSWSNYGNCVDFFAPGANITAAWYTGNSATNTISGTSMAAPHVAGAAALYLVANPGSSPAQVRDGLYALTTKGVVTSSSTANNHLLYTLGIGGTTTTPTNNPPTANFTANCSGLTCAFADGSTDSDGSIASRAWTFGDGATSTATNPSRTYAAGGTYTVTLTVTDDKGATGTKSQAVTVTAPSSGGFTLTASGYKVKGAQLVDLAWSGATGTNVDYYRGTTKVTTGNDGTHTDDIGAKGGGSYTYRVCNTGTQTCSNSVTVTF